MHITQDDENGAGDQWAALDIPPAIPASLSSPPAGTPGQWWASAYPDAWSMAWQGVYVFVTGDGGPTPFCVTTYLLPEGPDEEGRDSPPPPRLPTFVELWEIASRFTLTGTLLAPVGVGGAPCVACSGSEPPPFVDGTAYQMVQMGALDNSPAAIRWKLAAGGAVLGGPLIIPGA